uniref:Uncharacterized protein n=1 Tax=Knipowitschia caucasica TaxID=637954 RepID=A0AAV2K5E8_KNICA
MAEGVMNERAFSDGRGEQRNATDPHRHPQNMWVSFFPNADEEKVEKREKKTTKTTQRVEGEPATRCEAQVKAFVQPAPGEKVVNPDQWRTRRPEGGDVQAHGAPLVKEEVGREEQEQ